MKRIWQLVIIVPILIGVIWGIRISLKNGIAFSNDKEKIEKVFGVVKTRPAEITKFYTYGTSLNVEGKIPGISKDNYEGIKIYVTDGAEYNKEYKVNISFENNDLIFSLKNNINNAINLEELELNHKYYIQIRLKVNNSKDYKYYMLSNASEYKDIEYYSLTKDGKNNKIDIKFDTQNYNDKDYEYLGITVSEGKLPENVYDIVIDAGHGGKDLGQSSGNYSEAVLMLEYAKSLKSALESKGYKVKLTRDDSNTESYNYNNMYDDYGRISIACKTHAKYMISLHLNDSKVSGVEVYAPNNSDLTLAKKIADNICGNSSLEYSNAEAFKILDGVYVENFRDTDISSFSSSLQKKGIEPYEITTDTPYLYTIREVGGIATHAYVDGRNTEYSANKYYNSNQGIECYQVSLGNIKSSDLEILLNEQQQIVNAIANVFER